MKNFMNELGQFIEPSERNIIEEYRRYEDVTYISRMFNITNAEVRKVLKQAGIQIKSSRRKNKDLDPLREVGMSERDFYRDRD